MNVKHYTANKIVLSSWINNNQHKEEKTAPPKRFIQLEIDLLSPLRNWLDNIEVRDRILAHRICQLIPTQCPFERKVQLFGRTILHIPPLCKLNPLYNEVVALRFRALCYLADKCGEDVSCYC
ncbi:Mo-dependent nitrogenase C-terminal domain-containing protein [Pleurocapsales cyanobacterium LEGE 06147]|nr:Mo-dependent nitrogenase C-terminal domain-containing protein [Pleurocapsales cyanobacterium LEGE 06147]